MTGTQKSQQTKLQRERERGREEKGREMNGGREREKE